MSPSAILWMKGSKSAWDARGTRDLYKDSNAQAPIPSTSTSPSHLLRYSVLRFAVRIRRSTSAWTAPAFSHASSNHPMTSESHPSWALLPAAAAAFVSIRRRWLSVVQSVGAISLEVTSRALWQGMHPKKNPLGSIYTHAQENKEWRKKISLSWLYDVGPLGGYLERKRGGPYICREMLQKSNKTCPSCYFCREKLHGYDNGTMICTVEVIPYWL